MDSFRVDLVTIPAPLHIGYICPLDIVGAQIFSQRGVESRK